MQRWIREQLDGDGAMVLQLRWASPFESTQPCVICAAPESHVRARINSADRSGSALCHECIESSSTLAVLCGAVAPVERGRGTVRAELILCAVLQATAS